VARAYQIVAIRAVDNSTNTSSTDNKRVLLAYIEPTGQGDILQVCVEINAIVMEGVEETLGLSSAFERRDTH
jgi:hypothetical protein